MPGKFEIYQSDKNQKYYFRLKAGNGEVILTSQGYSNKSGAQNGVESVTSNCKDPGCFEKKTATNGKFHFNLKAKNGQIIGSSQMYKTERGCNNGMGAVGRAAESGRVVDMAD
jgi:uncharacterized protein YegP (UPF0339 family)